MSSQALLSLNTEQTLLIFERIIFAFSSLLNSCALFCLIRETPPHQSQIRTYLLFIQATVIISDVYFSVLFEPFPVFHVFAGYCVGLLCRSVKLTILFGIYANIVALMGATILQCSIHRHQTIVTRGRWALSQRARSVLRWLLHIIYCGPCLVFATFPFSREESETLIEKSTVDVRWIRDRGGYFMMKRTAVPLTIVALLVIILSVSFAVFALVFAHLFVVLEKRGRKSSKLKRQITISMIRLFMQIGVPILFILVPFTILMIEVCFSFDFCLYVTSIIPFHPIVHNAILILILPEYRNYFISLLEKILPGRKCCKSTGPSSAPDS
ncbi:hypothetical protein PENTCL1PPCAC_5012, partial [Pristionchus entomophagus]